jgi:hypothetical protein
MVTFHVHKSGNDSNGGLTQALAKLTLQAAVTAAANNDTVRVYSGVYSEIIAPISAKSLTFIGDGKVIIDGENSFTTFTTTTLGTSHFRNIHFRRFTSILISSHSHSFLDCEISEMPSGTSSGTRTAANTVFRDITGTAIAQPVNPAADAIYTSCTFVNCGKGISSTGGGGISNAIVQNCIFRSNTTHLDFTILSAYHLTSGGNDIDFSTGNCKLAATTYTTLSTWQAAVSLRDSVSVSADPKFLDENKKMYGLKADSPCLFSGLLSVADRVQGAFNRKIGGGGVAVMEGFSSGRNTTIWNGAVLVNTLQNASGNYTMASGTVEGSTVFTSVFSSGINIGRIFVNEEIYYPLAVIDHDNTDTAPNRLTLRARFSPDIVPTYGPYINFEPGTDVAQSGIRQMEITAPFRKNGVSA